MFSNYEIRRLTVENSEFSNLIILGLLFLAAIVSVRRRKPTGFMGQEQTGQLKGMAILFIVLSHLWVHVSTVGVNLNLANYGVALFLVFSGFGLTLSSRKRSPSLGYFVKRRLSRVMLPYWVVTVLLLVLDWIFLRRLYAPGDLVATFVGINLNDATRHIDYVRWFVTFILFWYVLFFAAIRLEERFHVNAVFILLGCAAFLFPLDYYVTRFSWDQMFAFPAGCLLARYHERLGVYFLENRKKMLWAALLLGGAAVGCDLMLKSNAITFLPSIVCKFAGEMNNLVLVAASLAVMAALGAAGYCSRFFHFCGTVSYELFLLHGAFLVRHNPIFGLMDIRWLPLSFVLLLCLLLGMLYFVHKTVTV